MRRHTRISLRNASMRAVDLTQAAAPPLGWPTSAQTSARAQRKVIVLELRVENSLPTNRGIGSSRP